MNTAAGTVRAQGGATASSVSLPAVVRRVLNDLAVLTAQRRAFIEVCRTAEDPLVRGSEQAVQQIVHHLLKNALEASPSGGLVRVAQHEHDAQVILEITDEGSGIHAGDFSRIFKRGFTTKANSKGQGLAEVEWRLAELRGAISWESPLRSGRGACFTVTLPSAGPPLSP